MTKYKMTDETKKSARDWGNFAKDLAYIAGLFFVGVSWQQVLGIILLGIVAFLLAVVGFSITWAIVNELKKA